MVSNCEVEEAYTPLLNQSVGVEVEYTTAPKLLSAEKGNELPPPPEPVMVMGDAPRTVNAVQDTVPEHDADVVAVLVIVLPFTTYASWPGVQVVVVAKPLKVNAPEVLL